MLNVCDAFEIDYLSIYLFIYLFINISESVVAAKGYRTYDAYVIFPITCVRHAYVISPYVDLII